MSLANGLLLIKHGPLQNEHMTESGENDIKNVALEKMMSLYEMSI